MKKVLLTLCLISGMIATNAQQSLVIHYEAWSSPMGAGVPNQPVWVNITNTLTSNAQYRYTTNSNGHIGDTLPHPGAQATVSFITYDCNGNLISGSDQITPSTTFAGDTGIVFCPLVINCQSFIRVVGSSSGLTFSFQDSTFSVPRANAITHISSWDFGDGNSSTVVNNWGTPHTYAAPGVYNVCLISRDEDTLNGITLCADTVCQLVTVGGGNPTNFCNASYWVDTLGSGSGSVNIYNSSTPVLTNTSFQNSYSWDFGDGSAAVTSAFPSHTYANPGMYQVCLSITSVDAQNNICTDTYCDSLGMDANGNLIYKTSAGFTLNVLDPATIGLNDLVMKNIELYPNPANTEVNVSLGVNAGNISWKLSDLKGTTIKGGVTSATDLKIDLSDVNKGMYFLTLENEKSLANYKLVVE